jgi:hypothetical protein
LEVVGMRKSMIVTLFWGSLLVYVIAGPDGVRVKEEAQTLPQDGSVPEQVPKSTMTGPRQQVS